MRREFKRNFISFGVTFVLSVSGFAWLISSNTMTWNLSGTGNWNTAINWTPAEVPDTAGESALIPAGTVNMNISPTLDALTMTGGTLNLGGNTLTLITATSNLGGTVVANTGTSAIDGSFTNALGGNLNILNTTSLHLFGPEITNNGTITINSNSGASITTLLVRADTLLNGTGSLFMARSGGSASLSTNPDVTLTNSAGHTIRGQGNLNAALVNQGTVRANLSGGTLNLITNNKTNTGVMRAENNGTLLISNITVQNTGGQIIADGGSVLLNGTVTLSNGTLSTANGGVIANNNGTNTLVNGVVNGTLNVLNTTTLGISGTGITNNGTLTLNSNLGGSVTTLLFNNNGTLGGTGTVILNVSGSAARINGDVGVTEVIHSATHTIRGRGLINAPLRNAGLVQADVSGGVMSLTTSDKTNTGTMRATNGGIMAFSGISVDNTGGQMIADNGTLRLSGTVTLSNGTLSTANGGVIANDNGTNTLVNGVVNGTLNVLNTTTLGISGTGLTNNGTLTLNSNLGGSVTTLLFNNNGTLGGTGTVILNVNGSAARINTVNNQVIVTHGADHTIRGRGQISGGFINLGLVQADVSGGTMAIVPGSVGFENRSTVKVLANSTISLTGNYAQTSGLTQVNGAFIVSGGVFSLQGGVLKGTGTITGTINNVVEGEVQPGNSLGTLTITGNYTQLAQGILRMELSGTGAGQFDKLAITGTGANGNVQLGGRLELEMVDGFNPTFGDEFEIMTYRVRQGKFAEFNFPPIPSGTMWAFAYRSNHLKMVVAREGDINGDGCINDEDLLEVLFNFGTADPASDIDASGLVDDIDLLIVLFNFGVGC
ncbi:MAG: hypothetical protein KIT45_00515 [Fimbriimonadia bacterium]|nr:hypothetical protein [Fimbriimonadia bacterium]